MAESEKSVNQQGESASLPTILVAIVAIGLAAGYIFYMIGHMIYGRGWRVWSW